ncbi:MAG TPA: hypothetical protein VG938_04105 [Verrucomicrobiae bacterium]|jgi:uncharacterized integral membrane protein|nr:hypothetical protein [Verrucomicrobiae bacterium]
MITIIIGVFFLLLAAINAFAMRRNYLAAQKQQTPAVTAKRRIAIIFALVGAGLVLLGLFNR